MTLQHLHLEIRHIALSFKDKKYVLTNGFRKLVRASSSPGVVQVCVVGIRKEAFVGRGAHFDHINTHVSTKNRYQYFYD